MDGTVIATKTAVAPTVGPHARAVRVGGLVFASGPRPIGPATGSAT